jgi:hypothetical protein
MIEYNKKVTGIFEYHVTVNLGEKPLEVFIEYCRNYKDIKLKPIVIQLPAKNPTQVMTSSYKRGLYPENVQDIKKIANDLKDSGFQVSRIKIESMASNEGVPINSNKKENERTINHFTKNKGTYFEFHYRIPVENHNFENILKKLCKENNAHLSKNPLKDSSSKYVTTRCFDCGRQEAFEKYYHLEKVLLENNFTVEKSEREFVVYDTNLDIDDGWE